MALTDATRLADFSSGVGTDGTLSANHINATGVLSLRLLLLVVDLVSLVLHPPIISSLELRQRLLQE